MKYFCYSSFLFNILFYIFLHFFFIKVPWSVSLYKLENMWLLDYSGRKIWKWDFSHGKEDTCLWVDTYHYKCGTHYRTFILPVILQNSKKNNTFLDKHLKDFFVEWMFGSTKLFLDQLGKCMWEEGIWRFWLKI